MTVHIWDGSTDGDWATAANWTPEGPPGTGDEARIPADASVNIDGSDQTGTAIDILTIEEGCSITIGDATTALQLSCNGETNGEIKLAGTGVTYIDLTDVKTVTITEAAASPGSNLYGMNVTSSASADTYNAPLTIACSSNDSVGIAAHDGEAAEFASITVQKGTVQIGDSVTEHDGSTAGDVTIHAGDVVTESSIFTLAMYGGTLRAKEGLNTGNIVGGTLFFRSVETIVNLNVYEATVDFTEDPRARTITNCDVWDGAAIKDPFQTVTFTNDIDLNQCGLADVDIDGGKNRTVGFSAI